MRQASYNRSNAVEYARYWALKRNPRYSNFTGMGGDCANFASQCLYAGTGVMNYKPVLGWYYNSLNDRTPSWTGVRYLYNFLIGNRDAGPQGEESTLEAMEPGDIIQIASYLPDFHHTLVVVETGAVPSFDNTLICAHSYDSLNRPLSGYNISRIRFIHII